jgi:hypothetical protein
MLIAPEVLDQLSSGIVVDVSAEVAGPQAHRVSFFHAWRSLRFAARLSRIRLLPGAMLQQTQSRPPGPE